MNVTGKIVNTGFDFDGKLQVTFVVNEVKKAMEEIEVIRVCEKLRITAKKYRNKKSDQARKYFWHLIGELASFEGVTNWDEYLNELRKYGVCEQLVLPKEAFNILSRQFRAYQIEEEWEYNGTEMISVIFYIGISEYNTLEMSRLIQGVIEDSKDAGIDVITPDELRQMLEAWKGAGYDTV